MSFGFPFYKKWIYIHITVTQKNIVSRQPLRNLEKPFLKVSHFCLPGKQSGEWEQGRFLALELLFVLGFTIPWL